MIIGISGKAGSGKDTLADTLVKDHGFVKVALADPMKRFCMEVFDFTEEQLWGPSEKRNEPDKRYPREHTYDGKTGTCACCGAVYYEERGFDGDGCYLTPRYALQQLGTEWGRNCYHDTWVNYALTVAKDLLTPRDWRAWGSAHPDYSPTLGIIERPCQLEETGQADPGNPVTAGLPLTVRGRRFHKGVVISDIRFINELAAVKKLGKVVRVKRGPGWGPSGAQARHKSETEQDGIHDNEFDFVFENNGALDDLLDYAGWLMGQLRGEKG